MVIESYTGMLLAEAEAERDSLRAVNAELVAACKLYVSTYDKTQHRSAITEEAAVIVSMRAALAKAKQS